MGQIGQSERDEAGAPLAETPSERVSMLLTGLVEWNGGQFPVRLRGLSSAGAEIEAAMIPPVGSIVHFSRGLLAFSGTVVASTAARYEIEFEGRANLDLLRRLAAARPTELPSHRFDREHRDWSQLPISKH